MNLFRKNRSQKPKDNVKDKYYANILLNKINGDVILDVQDYLLSPDDFVTDIKNFSLEDITSKENPIIRIEGTIPEIKIQPQLNEDRSTYDALFYEGFILINDFPLLFSAYKDKRIGLDLRHEELMLESGKSAPLTMTGRLFDTGIRSSPYKLWPYVLQFGDYINPSPRTSKKPIKA